MKRNTHVSSACNHVIAQLTAQIAPLMERRRSMERIAKLRFDEAADLTFAATLENLAQRLAENNASAVRQTDEDAKALEAQARKLSADSRE